MNTNLNACQSSLVHNIFLQALLEVHFFFRFFRARGGDEFFTEVLEMRTNHAQYAL